MKPPRMYAYEIYALPENEREAAIINDVPKKFHAMVRDLVESWTGLNKWMRG